MSQGNELPPENGGLRSGKVRGNRALRGFAKLASFLILVVATICLATLFLFLAPSTELRAKSFGIGCCIEQEQILTQYAVSHSESFGMANAPQYQNGDYLFSLIEKLIKIFVWVGMFGAFAISPIIGFKIESLIKRYYPHDEPFERGRQLGSLHPHIFKGRPLIRHDDSRLDVSFLKGYIRLDRAENRINNIAILLLFLALAMDYFLACAKELQ